ncbi:hypothetical protein D043_0026B, partial [Vibrio parahaemolyticus EKP-021]
SRDSFSLSVAVVVNCSRIAIVESTLLAKFAMLSYRAARALR